MNRTRYHLLSSALLALAATSPKGEPKDTTPPDHLKTTPLPEEPGPPRIEMYRTPRYDYRIPDPPKRKQRHEGDQSWKTAFPDMVRGHAPSRVGVKRR